MRGWSFAGHHLFDTLQVLVNKLSKVCDLAGAPPPFSRHVPSLPIPMEKFCESYFMLQVNPALNFAQSLSSVCNRNMLLVPYLNSFAGSGQWPI